MTTMTDRARASLSLNATWRALRHTHLSRAVMMLLFLVALACADDDPTRPNDPVKPVAVVAVSPETIDLPAGETRALGVTLKAADGTILQGRLVTWSSDNLSVATVDAAGRVAAMSAGTATISAHSEGTTGSARVRVPRPALASVELNPYEAVLQPNDAVHLDLVARDADGNVIELPPDAVIAFASSNDQVATVSGDGTVIARRKGQATITVTVDGKSAQALVNVTEAAGIEYVLSRSSDGNLPLTVRRIPQPSDNPELQIMHVLQLTGGRLRLAADLLTYQQQFTIETWEVVTYRGSTMASLKRTDAIEEDGTMGTVSGVGTYYFLPNQPGFRFTGWHSESDGFTLKRRVADSATEYTLLFAPAPPN